MLTGSWHVQLKELHLDLLESHDGLKRRHESLAEEQVPCSRQIVVPSLAHAFAICICFPALCSPSSKALASVSTLAEGKEEAWGVLEPDTPHALLMTCPKPFPAVARGSFHLEAEHCQNVA